MHTSSSSVRSPVALAVGGLLAVTLLWSVGLASEVPVVSLRTSTATADTAAPDLSADAPAVSLTPVITVRDAGPEQRAQLDQAVARFLDAGMALPDLEVSFHPDDAPCQGHLGLFRRTTRPWSVRICSDLPFVATHELAHAWIDANVDTHLQSEILDLTGLTGWRGEDLPWGDRGVERTAFVVQQVLMSAGGPLTETWEQRHEVFELATGAPVPRVDRWTEPPRS